MLGIVFGILPVVGGLGFFLTLQVVGALQARRTKNDLFALPAPLHREQPTFGLKQQNLALLD